MEPEQKRERNRGNAVEDSNIPDVLLIEDNTFLAESTIRWLEVVCGLNVQLASSLTEAKGALAKYPPRIILCDNQLPDGLGLDFLRSYKNTHPKVICLLWSGGLTKAERENAVSLDGCFNKGMSGIKEVQKALAKSLS